MTENDVYMVWVQKEVITCWFVTFTNFCAKWPKLLIVIFWSCIDVKQQQSDRKWCEKDLGEKRKHLGLVFTFHRFLCRRYCTLITSIC